MRRALLVLIIAVVGLIIGCSTQSEKGDYIIEKEIDSNIPMILVAENISKEDSKTKSIFELMKDGTDLMWYHIEDTKLYADLNVGERVSVEAKTSSMDGKEVSHVMLSNPPQTVAGEIIRHSKKQ
ncbi:DUF3221 domain-containing protein [Paenibacillus prosopidis]|uniref:Uncharacterized protein DUF3221 n=1 Tax=Paenibacillus prosopidis TaxID=630520 RepID=A0A368VMS8_9BACL|nr:DUF3221 domain-containing protein [Paenibacillus prosopidis]RCW40342.1 uncharacterized protein DUF3221 [Paenibacillus prosopidis]